MSSVYRSVFTRRCNVCLDRLSYCPRLAQDTSWQVEGLCGSQSGRNYLKRVDTSHWRYVNTLFNPADLVSKGVMPAELIKSSIWWEGPTWLNHSPARWPRRPHINRGQELPDIKLTVLVMQSPLEEYGKRFSNFSKMCRVTAWILRLYYKT